VLLWSCYQSQLTFIMIRCGVTLEVYSATPW
jgi:hypothetical protein